MHPGNNIETCCEAAICGGCQYQGIKYSTQLEIKFNHVKNCLDSKEIEYEKLYPIEPAPELYSYRNKMKYSFGISSRDGSVALGTHEKEHTMSVISADKCQLVHEDFNKILSATIDFVNEKGYAPYDMELQKGLLRNLIVRRGVRTGELLVNIVTTTESAKNPDRGLSFDEKGFTNMIKNLELENTVVGILRTFNDCTTGSLRCDSMNILYGRDWYLEKIMGLNFKVSAFSFFQTNITTIENLYTYALSLLDETGNDYSGKTAFDLFCGTGTITQVLAKKTKMALGIEKIEEAVEAARINAELNGLNNCRFIAGDCFEVLNSIDNKPDVIVVDPPRSGIENDALAKIISYGVENIIYISCGPESLAENLYYMQLNGYKVKTVKPFDNFPWTQHVETVTLLSKVK